MRDTLETGEVIDDRYHLERLLGRGSAATVYAARDIELERDVAIKVLHTRLTESHEMIARFRREADVQARIHHHNVAALYGRGIVASGQPYLAIELLRGRSLRDVIESEAPIEPRRVGEYGLEVLAGLGAIHRADVLHRDLKPANIMLEPAPDPAERVVLIDFGFAYLRRARRLTPTAQVVGSLGYLAPERLQGTHDPRSDLYSLAIVLFELLAGRRPFVADTDLRLAELHLEAPVPPIAAVGRPVAPAGELEDLIRIALAKDPRDRFPDAGAMAAALAAIDWRVP